MQLWVSLGSLRVTLVTLWVYFGVALGSLWLGGAWKPFHASVERGFHAPGWSETNVYGILVGGEGGK